MKALLTGASGTVGRALTAHLRASGHEVVAWDRAAAPPDDYAAMERCCARRGAGRALSPRHRLAADGASG